MSHAGQVSSARPGGHYFQSDFTAAEFAERRAKVAKAIGPRGVAVLAGAQASGAFDIFRQTNDFYYLSGIEVPQSYLAVAGSGRSVLYLPERDPKLERSEGPQLSCEDEALVRALTGVDAVRNRTALAAEIAAARQVFTPMSPAETRQACRDTLRHARHAIDSDPWDGDPARETKFRQRLSAALAAGSPEWFDLSPILDELRIVKSAAEVKLMRRAGQLTALGVCRAMQATKPGVMEYQLAAEADYVFLEGGARGGGYRPIAACGENIWNAHYYRNNCPLVDGELMLLDYAPDLGCYTSDIGRMWPVSGRYSPAQRELYGFIVAYHKTLLGLIHPGRTAAEITAEAAQRMAPVVERTAWSRPAFAQAARDTLSFQGHLSHPVGMAVHDVGDYKARPLVPGVVLALDPQMWAHDERIYIRVEDTVAVTADGVRVLTREAPLELDDVERLMSNSR